MFFGCTFKEIMSGVRANSVPELAPAPTTSKQQYDDSALEGESSFFLSY